MTHDRFIGLVQNRAHLASTAEALTATRATLETLSERIEANEASDLAAQLPREIGHYLKENPVAGSERFSFDEFCRRIAVREHRDLSDAVFHARCVVGVLKEAVASGEISDVRAQLPDEFDPLFSAGSQGQMKQPE
ncbi:MAG: DUF2267 domain-containing protein [Verrucomicrobiota bacterium]|nr:DUF2267 domain-containing protein [Verrucomicrobiota bacterium]